VLSLYHLRSARIQTVRRSEQSGGLQLPARHEGRSRGARSSADRASPSYRALHGRLYCVAGRTQSPGRVRSLVLAGTGSVSERWYTEDFHKRSRDLAAQFEKDGSAAVAQTYGRSASRITFELKDPRGFAEFSRQLAEHDAQGSAHMSRGFQGTRPSLYDFEAEIRKLSAPALIVVGDEDERCIEPAIFLKDTISASGLALLPKTGHAVNLEEPDLFNLLVGDFLARVDRGNWLPRDPRTRAPKPPPKTS